MHSERLPISPIFAEQQWRAYWVANPPEICVSKLALPKLESYRVVGDVQNCVG